MSTTDPRMELRDALAALCMTAVVRSRVEGPSTPLEAESTYQRVLEAAAALRERAPTVEPPRYSIRMFQGGQMHWNESETGDWVRWEDVAALYRGAPPPPSPEIVNMDDAAIRHMVNRFLSWRLPEEFHPDGGINFMEWYNTHTDRPMRHAPVGTNLFSYTQAEAMVRHMIEGIAGDPPETLRAEPDTFWLIERSQIEGSEIIWYRDNDRDFRRYNGDWVKDANVATKFTSRRECEDAIRLLFTDIRDRTSAHATSHSFLAVPRAPTVEPDINVIAELILDSGGWEPADEDGAYEVAEEIAALYRGAPHERAPTVEPDELIADLEVDVTIHSRGEVNGERVVRLHETHFELLMDERREAARRLKLFRDRKGDEAKKIRNQERADLCLRAIWENAPITPPPPEDMRVTAWGKVYDLCQELGMTNDGSGLSGIECVLHFIRSLAGAPPTLRAEDGLMFARDAERFLAGDLSAAYVYKAPIADEVVSVWIGTRGAPERGFELPVSGGAEAGE